MKEVKIMNNWDKYKRMLCNILKATYNYTVLNLMELHYHLLHSTLVNTPLDEDVFNDTYLKMTYKYNPLKDFIELFKWLFQLLKGAYYRDDKANRFYKIKDNLLSIPDFIPDLEKDTDVSIVNRFKSLLCRT